MQRSIPDTTTAKTGEAVDQLVIAVQEQLFQLKRSRGEFLDKISEELTDPIHKSLIREPVVAADGHLYDRESITHWIEKMGLRAISPRTGKVLSTNTTRPCQQVLNIIRLLIEEVPHLKEQTERSLVEADYELAMKLHLDELRAKLIKDIKNRDLLEEDYRALHSTLDRTNQSLHEKINYYEHKLMIAESELTFLRNHYEEALKLLDRFKSLESHMDSIAAKGFFPGLIFQEIHSNGACLFHAVGLFLGLEQKDLREMVANYLVASGDEFQPLFLESGCSKEEYINHIKITDEWGHHLEIVVMQRIFNRPIVIIRPDRNPIIPDLSLYTGAPIFIYYNGSTHYDAFILEKEGNPTAILAEMQRQIATGKTLCFDKNQMLGELKAKMPKDLSLETIDLSACHELSYSALVDVLRQNPTLKKLKTSIYKVEKEMNAHPLWIDKIIRLPDDTFLTASQHPYINRWDGIFLKKVAEYRGHGATLNYRDRASQVYDLSLSPDKGSFASACADRQIKIWDLATNSCMHTFSGIHGRDICCVCYISETLIASGSREGVIILTDITTGGTIATLIGHTVDVYGLVYLKDKHLLVSCAGNTGTGEIKVWDLNTNLCIRNLEGHDDLIYEMIKTEDDAYVITGCDDRTICVWDTKDWTYKKLSGHRHYVNTLAMLDDTTLVSGGEDKMIKIWNIAMGICLATYEAKGKIWGITCLSNHDILCGDTNGVLYAFRKQTFDLNFREYLKTACVVSEMGTSGYVIEISLKKAYQSTSTHLQFVQSLRPAIEFVNTILQTTISCYHSNLNCRLECPDENIFKKVTELLRACQGLTESDEFLLTLPIPKPGHEAASLHAVGMFSSTRATEEIDGAAGKDERDLMLSVYTSK